MNYRKLLRYFFIETNRNKFINNTFQLSVRVKMYKLYLEFKIFLYGLKVIII